MQAQLTTTVKKENSLSSRKFIKILPLLCMTVPFFLLVIIFSYIPIWGWSIAFVDYSPGVGILASKFVGLKYFFRLFDVGSIFLNVVRNTIVLSSLMIIFSPVPAMLAIMITEVKNRYFRRAVQTILSFPNFISWIIVYSLFFAFLSVDDGILNRLLVGSHIISRPVDVLADPQLTWGLMTFASLWKTAGWSAIIYIAAIAAIDQEMYQAAEVDGANRFRKILHVTIPGILPTFAVILVLSIGQFLNMGFEQYYVFYNSMVHEVLEVIDTYTYRMGILNYDFSFSTAVGITKTVVSILLLFLANVIHRKIMGRSII